MEDNVLYAKGRLAKNNAEFVARAAGLVRETNGTVATPDSARLLLDLPVRPSLTARPTRAHATAPLRF